MCYICRLKIYNEDSISFYLSSEFTVDVDICEFRKVVDKLIDKYLLTFYNYDSYNILYGINNNIYLCLRIENFKDIYASLYRISKDSLYENIKNDIFGELK